MGKTVLKHEFENVFTRDHANWPENIAKVNELLDSYDDHMASGERYVETDGTPEGPTPDDWARFDDEAHRLLDAIVNVFTFQREEA